MWVMSVIENVAMQACAIDHFIGKDYFLLINQFIHRENFFILENIPHKRLLWGILVAVANSARTDLFCAVIKIVWTYSN